MLKYNCIQVIESDMGVTYVKKGSITRVRNCLGLYDQVNKRTG